MKKFFYFSTLLLGLTSSVLSQTVNGYVEINKSIENKKLNYLFKVSHDLAFDSAVPDSIEKFYNPKGILQKNEYNRCVNRLSDFIKIGPIKVSETKYRYCRCVAKEIKLFRRLKNVVFNEARHCMKLL